MHVLISSCIAKCCTVHFGRLHCTYRKSTIKPSWGFIYFKHIWEGVGGLLEIGGLFTVFIYLLNAPVFINFQRFRCSVYVRVAFIRGQRLF